MTLEDSGTLSGTFAGAGISEVYSLKDGPGGVPHPATGGGMKIDEFRISDAGSDSTFLLLVNETIDIPEPATMLVMGIGGLLALLGRKRK